MKAMAGQPPPIVTDCRRAWDIVIEHVEHRQETDGYGKTGVVVRVLRDMRDRRDRDDRPRYGDRDHLMVAYGGALDLVVSLAAELDEHSIGPETQIVTTARPDGWRLFRVQSMLWDQIRSIIRLRALIEEAVS